MKFIHISDLHLGKKVNGFSMIDDQKFVLRQIIKQATIEKVDGILIAGDVYDKMVPPLEAVVLLDWFLCEFVERKIPVFLIAGNHDSPERLGFAKNILAKTTLFMEDKYRGKIEVYSQEDSFGKVNIYMLPFVKKNSLKSIFEEDGIQTLEEGMVEIFKREKIDESERNIILSHQFVQGATRCESEELMIGGSDAISANIFEAFDYVALGHLHGPQKVGSDNVRYCGTPLKYSFSEINHKKSITLVELKEKGNLVVREIPFYFLRDFREIKGSYMEVTNKSFYGTFSREDYMFVTLTDEEDIPEAIGKLRTIYPNIMKLEYDNQRTRGNQLLEKIEHIDEKTPIQLFEEFYEKQNNAPMSESQFQVMEKLIDEIWEEMP